MTLCLRVFYTQEREIRKELSVSILRFVLDLSGCLVKICVISNREGTHNCFWFTHKPVEI